MKDFLNVAKSVKPAVRVKLAYGGHKSSEEAQPTGYFEVAPGETWDPKQQASWEKLHPQAKQAISNKMVGEFLSPWQRISGIHGEVKRGLGGFGGFTNPNFSFHPYDPSKMGEALNQLGELFRQDSMMGAHAQPFAGSFPSGVVRVHMPKGVSPEEAHAAYQTLNKLGLAEGHSTDVDNGTMDILSGDGEKETIRNAKLIDKALKGKYDVSSYPTNVSFPSHGGEYGISGSPSSQSPRTPTSQAHSDLQAKASARLQELLDEAHRQGGGHKGEVNFGDTLAQGQPHPDTLPALIPKSGTASKGPQPIGQARPEISPSSHSIDNLHKIASSMWKYHPASGGEELAGPQALDKITDLYTKNLLSLWDSTPQSQRQTSRFWYRAANALGNKYAEHYGIQPRAAHGIIAVLSPQNAWDKNVTQAERLMDILHHHLDTRWTSAMSQVAQGGGSKGAGLPEDKGTKETGPHRWDDVKGKTLREVLAGSHGHARAAMWVRAFDEAHNPTEYQAISPTGEFTGTQMNKTGTAPDTASWNSYSPIRKAISIWHDPSRENINEQIGDNHKVREFYNVITNPDDPNGVVVDTHAVAAGELLPHGSSAKMVHRNFGSSPTVENKAYLEKIGTPWIEGESPSKTTGPAGAKGDYPIHAESVRRAAWARGVHPSEMQSVTWERARQLFSNKGPEAQRIAHDIWRRHGTGELTHEQAMNELLDKFGGENERAASWHATQQGASGLGNVQIGSYQRPTTIDPNAPPVQRYADGGFIPHGDPRRAANLDAFDPIRDEHGKPRVFYHGTRNKAGVEKDIKSFRTNVSELGSHFGTKEQAHDTGFIGEEDRDQGQIYPVHLNIKNPIRLRDLGKFNAANVKTQLRELGHHVEDDASHQDIQNYLKSIGHDGIVYLNRREGLNNWKSGLNSPIHFNSRSDEDFKKAYPEAHDSYIAFDPHQIKSAIGNNGNFDPNSPNIHERRGGYVRRAYKKGGKVEGGVWHEKDVTRKHFDDGGSSGDGGGAHSVLGKRRREPRPHGLEHAENGGIGTPSGMGAFGDPSQGGGELGFNANSGATGDQTIGGDLSLNATPAGAAYLSAAMGSQMGGNDLQGGNFNLSGIAPQSGFDANQTISGDFGAAAMNPQQNPTWASENAAPQTSPFGQPQFGTTQFGQAPLQSGSFVGGTPQQSLSSIMGTDPVNNPMFSDFQTAQEAVPGQYTINPNAALQAVNQYAPIMTSGWTPDQAMQAIQSRLPEGTTLSGTTLNTPMSMSEINQSLGQATNNTINANGIINPVTQTNITGNDWSSSAIGSMPNTSAGVAPQTFGSLYGAQPSTDSGPTYSQPSFPSTPTPSTAYSQPAVGAGTPLDAYNPTTVSPIRADFNNAFAAAAAAGQQTFQWTNPSTGQTGTYAVKYRAASGRTPQMVYPRGIVEHALAKISAPPPALDPRMVARRGRP